MITPIELHRWCVGIGLPYFVGYELVRKYGRLPKSVDELNTWGRLTGLRDTVTEEWHVPGEDGAIKMMEQD